MGQKEAIVRFYEELNDFLPPLRRKRPFPYRFFGAPAIKDVIEALGVPHVEVDLVLVNGVSVDFEYHLNAGDRISVYPVFESVDITPLIRLRAKPLRNTRFILDVHLGKTAKLLRMLGFDTLYRNDFSDDEIVELAVNQQRIILTRDKGLLKIGRVTHGYWIRSPKPKYQIDEILNRFDLFTQIKPFHRCTVCNNLVQEVKKEHIEDQLEIKTRQFYNEFFICPGCNRIYWKGSHYTRMKETIHRVLAKKKPKMERSVI